MSAVSREQVLARVRELPPLPAVVAELILSMEDDELSAAQLARKVSGDPALAARTLRLANSSFYGMSRQVESVADATALLGLRTLRSIALAVGVSGSFTARACDGFEIDGFWRHSVGTALCARAVAKALGRDEEVAFTLGLLHDIGRLALATFFPAEFAATLQQRRAHDLPALDAERAVLGIDHAEVGSLIASHWHFAPSVAAAIGAHHAPERCADGTVDLLHVADNMAHALDLDRGADAAVPALSMPAWSRLALSDAQCRRIFRQTESQFDGVCQALLS